MNRSSANPPERVVLSWSGGKDSALALQALRNGNYQVVSLLCTVAGEYGRVSHHGVRVELLEAQARAVGVPLHRVDLPSDPHRPCTNEHYEKAMSEALEPYLDAGIRTVAFGDLFLEDIREYREDRLARVGMKGLFPIWGEDTSKLVRRFIDDGFKARLSCVTMETLGERFAGRELDAALLADLPKGVDPCGEKGDYHSFVYDGPIFEHPLGIRVGEKVKRDVRCFADLILDPVPSPSPSRGKTAQPVRPLDTWAEGRLNDESSADASTRPH